MTGFKITSKMFHIMELPVISFNKSIMALVASCCSLPDWLTPLLFGSGALCSSTLPTINWPFSRLFWGPADNSMNAFSLFARPSL
uniref:Uncharacterized protein n=1 Tax=Anguilla anguilla TaxID=7936 RepID=A0A0E9RFI6_ANGAN